MTKLAESSSDQIPLYIGIPLALMCLAVVVLLIVFITVVIITTVRGD